jgi:hypothetical protein
LVPRLPVQPLVAWFLSIYDRLTASARALRGPKARQHIAEHGLQARDVGVVPGAAD